MLCLFFHAVLSLSYNCTLSALLCPCILAVCCIYNNGHESQLLYEQIAFDVLEIVLALMNSYVYLFSTL